MDKSMTLLERTARDPLALEMFAAWVNVSSDKLPAEMKGHTCPATMEAWSRVAQAARRAIIPEILEMAAKECDRFVNAKAWDAKDSEYVRIRSIQAGQDALNIRNLARSLATDMGERVDEKS